MRFSTLNKNMLTIPAQGNGGLACTTPILEKPLGYVAVSCQMMFVPVAEDTEGWAYWSRDGGATAVKFRDLQVGDHIYWNPFRGRHAFSWWQLFGNESISFHYLTDAPMPPPDDDGEGPIIEGNRLWRRQA